MLNIKYVYLYQQLWVTFIHVPFLFRKGLTSCKIGNFVQLQIKCQSNFFLSLVSCKYFTSLEYFCEEQVIQ